MELYSPGEDVERALFGVGWAYMLLGACVALWRGGRSAWSGGLAQGLLQYLTVPRRRAREGLEAGWEDKGANSVAQQAAEELQRRRLTLTKQLLPHGQFGGTVVIAAMWWGGTLPTTFAQNSASLANAIVLMVLWIAPSAVTRGSVDWIYSSMMAILSVTVWPIAVSADTVLVYANATWVIALALSIGFLKPWLNAIWILIITATSCLTLAVGERIGERNGGQFSNAQPFREAMQLATISVVSVLCLIVIDRLLQQLTRLELEAHSSRNELAAAQSVLRSVCDVVVEVDDALRLREDSPELRNMLFLNQHRSLRQEDLRSFLASAEDGAKFHERVQDATATGQPDGELPRLSVAFHVSMKDSAGITLEVEVFVVRFLDRKGYLVGIREQSADSAEELRGSRDRRGSCGREPSRKPSPCARAPLFVSGLPWDEAAEGYAPEGFVRSFSSSSAASSYAGALEDAKVSAWVDLLSEGWTILSVTDALQVCMGLAEKDVDFLPLVRSDQRERFIEFVQRVHFHRPDRAAPAAFGEPVFLRTAHMRRLNLWLCASLELDWHPAPCPPHPHVIRVSLGEISWLTGGQRGRRARRELRGTPRDLRPSPPRLDATRRAL